MSSTLGRLPDFLVIGAAKSGTSTFFSYLRRHPHVFDLPEKEPCFFDPSMNWTRGIEWYRSLFADARDDEICGEASTNYTRYPQVAGVPERIKRTVPGVRLVYLVRHPVERAYSHYVHRYTKETHAGEPFRMSFEEFVEREPMCLDGSDYAVQVERYLEHFDLDQMLILRQDALAEAPDAVLRRTQRFLGLPEHDLVAGSVHVENETRTELKRHTRAFITEPFKRSPWIEQIRQRLPIEWKQRAYDMVLRTPIGARIEQSFTPPPMREATRARLMERYRPSIERIERLTGEDLSRYYL
jgi:hypothetical protein